MNNMPRYISATIRYEIKCYRCGTCEAHHFSCTIDINDNVHWFAVAKPDLTNTLSVPVVSGHTCEHCTKSMGESIGRKTTEIAELRRTVDHLLKNQEKINRAARVLAGCLEEE